MCVDFGITLAVDVEPFVQQPQGERPIAVARVVVSPPVSQGA